MQLMFSGIIKEIGIIKTLRKKGRSVFFTIGYKKIRPAVSGSVAVNGVCLTLIKKNAGNFIVEVIPETLRRTNFSQLKKGDKVNLETSLRFNDFVHGHLVSGHVDNTEKVLDFKKGKNGALLSISVPKKSRRYIIEKGSIALNGVSLTVTEVGKNSFTAALTSFTEKNTNLGNLKKGDFVNIEVDLIARYIITYPICS